jgi:hypothetical protein
MSRYIMISTVFEKNRLSRLLKPIVGKSTPGYMVEKRHKFGEMTGRSQMGSGFSRKVCTSAHM